MASYPDTHLLPLPQLFTTKELCRLMGKREPAILRRSVSEVWQCIRRAKKLGGDQWILRTMPKETQTEIACMFAAQNADILSKQSDTPVNKAARQDSLNGMLERGKRVAEATAYIVSAVKHAIKAGTAAPSVVMEEFAVLYRKRQAPVPEWVYEAQPRAIQLLKIV